ncbi:hypothetical protein LTR36_003506 [Oleoguttula mirabilis]|uniref:Uncharacterized protein n=1 Tax=Oleoguttula mirabilis TaxID=1507867 RepID=A0AAV9JIT7_9PEZI|nr:hypothetical protein LTR36_003506 [Oleoguttula mirabilis]
MPGLVRKILICAAADGLFLHPVGARDSDSRSVKIAYGTSTITPATRNGGDEGEANPLEAHGIVGLLDLVSSSYLISITRREQVAQIQGSPIYALRDVTLIPLASQAEAERAITAAKQTLKPSKEARAEETEESDVGEDAEPSTVGDTEQPPETAALELPRGNVLQKSTSVVKDVVQDRGKYGRFAEKWFSKGGWAANGRRSQGMTSEEDLTGEQEKQAAEALPEPEQSAAPGAEKKSDEQQDSQEDSKPDTHTQTSKRQNVLESLTPRILRSARLYFSSSGFFFSYEHDLSTTLMQRDTQTTSLPLWKRFDDLYFWNQHLQRPFIENSQDAFILPLLQGFVGQRAFSIARTTDTEQDVVAEAAHKAEDVVAAQERPKPTDSSDKKESQEDYLITLISRRSVKRAGLRYLRRGIDDEGNVANSVETEQILSPQSWDVSSKTFALLQYRGSIPLFFSQTPYSFKPLPVMFGSEATNQTAFKKHFDKITKRYGSVQCTSLVDKHATEAGIGEAYEHHAKLLGENGVVNGKQIGFEWFDFHTACKGMKFENVSILMDTLESQLKSFGWTVKQDDRDVRQQTGVLRTNCMDCLDRTNVVQSAVGGWALQQQLADLGLNIDLKTDPKTQWFNTLWADNGDAISKQYAGTSALKGDFTRTRKRNWTGALSDFSLTLNRYYNNIFGDYFLQMNIDFYLGNVGPSAFIDFEADMMGKDYALDMGRIRQNAIDMCIKIVLEDPTEDLVAGWTLSCPREANTLRSLPFEECVLLLTDAALYFCRFDWDAEKVGSFERIALADITEVWRGAYITSTLGPTQTNETKNVGVALRYKTSGQAVVRTNTRAMQNEKLAEDENSGKNELEKQAQPEKEESRLLAFKALPPSSSAAKQGGEDSDHMSEQELVKHICDELQRLMMSVAHKQRGFDHLELEKVPNVEEKDIISVADARKRTGYMESLGYSLKKLVWS